MIDGNVAFEGGDPEERRTDCGRNPVCAGEGHGAAAHTRRIPVSGFEAVADVIHKAIKVDGEVYRVRIEPDLDDGGYVVYCETPPECASQGETVDEALEMIAEAIELVVETHREKGWPLASE